MDEITDVLNNINRDAICCREYADSDPSMVLVSAYAENIELWVARLRELVKAQADNDSKLCRAVDGLVRDRTVALECLADLYAVQNGCPLPGKYDEAWASVMRRAEKLLGIEAGEVKP